MSLFASYTKPGPGVSKDAPQKTAFFHFFEIYFRKFWDLIKMNLLYAVSIILFFIPIVMVLFPVFADPKNNMSGLLLNFQAANGARHLSLLNPWLLLYLLPLALTGPATAGFTYVMRNFAREEHAFLWSDYKDVAISNWKQSTGAMLINVVASMLLLFSTSYYFQNIPVNQLFVVPFIFSVIVSVLFLFMQYYIFVMIVTFRLKLSQIYRNALIFAFLGLGRNILITILSAIVLFISIYFVPLAIVFIPCLTLSTVGLIINFSVWPIIKKYMIDSNPDNTMKKDHNEEAVFEDIGREK